MSPEQAEAKQLDARSDLFSLGSVLYAMATGRPPFRGAGSFEVLKRIVNEPARPMREIQSSVPEWFETIVNRLHSKSPNDRPSSASEVAALLEEFLAHVQQPTGTSLPESLTAVAKSDTGNRPPIFNRRFIFNPTRKGVIAMLGKIGMTLLGMTLLGMVLWQETEAPDISGKWTSEEWGTVVLEAKEPGLYEGTFSGTDKDKPGYDISDVPVVREGEFGTQVVLTEIKFGTIELKWSRVERRFNGTWRKGINRNGKMSLRLVDNEIRGAWTTSKDAQRESDSPRLADLMWKRDTALSVAKAENRPLPEMLEALPAGSTTDEICSSTTPPDPTRILTELEMQRELGRNAICRIYDDHKDSFRIIVEPVYDKRVPVREYPIIGRASLHLLRYKCTVHFSPVEGIEWPLTKGGKLETEITLYVDSDHLHREDDGKRAVSRIEARPTSERSDLIDLSADEKVSDSGNRAKVIARENRWHVSIVIGDDLGEYRQRLQYFGIQPGWAFQDGRLAYLSNLTGKSTLQFGVTREEQRLFLVNNGGQQRDLDRQLFLEAGLNETGNDRTSKDGLSFHFYPREIEVLLQKLELETAQRPLEEIRSTQFEIRPQEAGYQFVVSKQTFRVEEPTAFELAPRPEMPRREPAQAMGNPKSKRLQIREATVVEDNADVSVQSEQTTVVEFSGRRFRIDRAQPAILTEDDIVTVESVTDPNNPKASQIVLTLTQEAGERFLIVTTRLSRQPTPGYLAIEFDGTVLSAPRVNDKISNKVAISASKDEDVEKLVAAIRESMEARVPGAAVDQPLDRAGSEPAIIVPPTTFDTLEDFLKPGKDIFEKEMQLIDERLASAVEGSAADVKAALETLSRLETSEPGRSEKAKASSDDEVSQLLSEIAFLNKREERGANSTRSVRYGAGVMRLTRFGLAAVPRIIEELDRTDDARMIATLAFVLRAIGDKRGVPALIRAIPRTYVPQDDCNWIQSTNVIDKELIAFFRQHKFEGQGDAAIGCSNAMTELSMTLSSLTGAKFALTYTYCRGTPLQIYLQKKLMYKDAERWGKWWEQNSSNMVDDVAYSKAGVPEFNMNSPGIVDPNQTLTEVAWEITYELKSLRGATAANVKYPFEFLDLDTGRNSPAPEQWRDKQLSDADVAKLLAWAASEGFDLTCDQHETEDGTRHYVVRGIGLKAWQLDEKSWKDDVLYKWGELATAGRSVVDDWLIPFVREKGVFDPEGKAPFLVVTREGSPVLINVGDEITDDSAKGDVILGFLNDHVGWAKGRRLGIQLFEIAQLEVPPGADDPSAANVEEAKDVGVSVPPAVFETLEDFLKPGDDKPQAPDQPSMSKTLQQLQGKWRLTRQIAADGDEKITPANTTWEFKGPRIVARDGGPGGVMLIELD